MTAAAERLQATLNEEQTVMLRDCENGVLFCRLRLVDLLWYNSISKERK
jgi:hypothetical protein